MFPQPFKTLAYGAALSALLAGGAMAQQTAPDTPVINKIELTYNSGDGTPTVTLPELPSHTVEFRVDRKLDLGVIAQSGGGLVGVVPGQSAVTFSYLVENRGNGTQGFVIDVTDTGNIDVVDGLTRSTTVTTDPGQFYVLVGPNADGSGGTIYNGGNAGDLAPGEDYYVVIVANIPITALDAQLEDFVVRATVTDAGTATPVEQVRDQGLMGVNRVFADASSDSARTADEIDIALNGQDADETRLEVRAPVITAQKAVVVLDEALPGSTFNCSDGGTATGDPLAAIPGACVEYTITVQNTSPSSTSATSIAITDPLSTTLTFVAVDNVTYSAGGSNASAPVHNGTNPGGTVSVTIDELPASSTATFRIRATIN